MLRELESSPTSPTSSRSTSAGWSDPSTPLSAQSPTTPSWSTSTRALTRWSTSSTTPRWTCKFRVGFRNAQAPLKVSQPKQQSHAPSHPCRSSSSIALKDNNGSFISTLSMALYKVPPFSQPGDAHAATLYVWVGVTASLSPTARI